MPRGKGATLVVTDKDVDRADLTEAQISFALEWAEGQLNMTGLAEKYGINMVTAYRWAKRPEIIRIKREANKELREVALGVLAQSAKKAAELLVKAMEDPEVTRTQLAARESVLDRIGLSVKQVQQMMGEGAEPIVIVDRTPHVVDARAQQEQRSRDSQAIEVTYIENVADLDKET